MKIESLPKIEKKEEIPKLKAKFIFGPHATEKDAQLLELEIPKSDVYCPESWGWSLQNEEDLNRVSQGELSPAEFLNNNRPSNSEFARKQLECLFNSKVLVKIVDIPSWEIRHEDTFAETIKYQAREQFYQGNLEKSIENYKLAIQLDAAVIRRREDYIIEELKNLLPKILEKKPELKYRKEISTLIGLGIVHTRPYHKIKREFPKETERILPPRPFSFGNYLRLLRRRIFKPDKKFSKEEEIQIARIAVEEIVQEGIFDRFRADVNLDSGTIQVISDFLVSQFNYNDIEKFSKDAAENNYHIDRNLEAVIKLLKENYGIKIPANKEELNELLSRVVRKDKSAR